MTYRFEYSPGLKHGCAVCGGPLNSFKAKKTCLGKHSEPCPRFHHTLFRVGRVSSCDSCKGSFEKRYERHTHIVGHVKAFHKAIGNKAPAINRFQVEAAIYGYTENEEALLSDVEGLVDGWLQTIYQQGRLHEKADHTARTYLEKLLNKEVRQILGRLGISEKDIRKAGNKCAELETTANAIVQEVDTTANESKETLKRQLGYYHYADKRAHKALTKKMGEMVLDELFPDWRENAESVARAVDEPTTAKLNVILSLISNTTVARLSSSPSNSKSARNPLNLQH